ncbi:hypothetical protein SAMN05444483_10134 [Salegentibacter echinorum]|uniref:Uncharacterized protein n=2 Tax=Salegentibacter echinorum TaxID=1073325 RepID=A0A1M5BHV2_SALEC|nr:hypothetical protein [Salegentibacter echinorum]SHF41857.1 hypothetical protein SAMN05444483_10134 [Salegentibacter echinorum]
MFSKFNKKDRRAYSTAMMFTAALFYFILGCTDINAQNEMLIGQISGRDVVRKNFDKEGDFLNKQTFSSGKIIDKNGVYEIKVVTELFDKDRKSTDKYTTTYRCEPDDANVMIMAFPFSKPKSKETEINTVSENFKKLYDLENLKDIELEMSFDSGLLNFFGSKSIIKIYDRKLEDGKNTIKSKINIKAYAWGIRVKQLNYTVIEKLNEEGLLTFQEFTEEDNSFFTINYK